MIHRNDKAIDLVVSLCVLLGTSCLSTTAFAQTRILHFPKDRSMGTLSVRDADGHGKSYRGFEELCEARGDVAIPVGKEVLLDLSREGAEDLSPLAKLKSDDLYSIDGWRIPIGDEDMQYLSGLTGLKRLYFYTVPISDKGLYHLRGLRSLECLILMDMKITDAGMPFLSDMDSLESLNLRATRVTDKGLEFLSGLKLLRSIDLGYCKITDAGLEHLCGMNSLESLDVSHSAITDAGLACLKNVRSLSDLNLDSVAVTDAGLAHLSTLPSLKTLNLRKARITDLGLAYLANARTLEELRLAGARITDSGLAHLLGLGSLKSLDINGTQITDNGLRHLGRLTSLESLVLPRGPDITEEGLTYLAELKRLRHFENIPGDISTRGIKILSNMALESINLRGAGIADEMMPYMGQLKNLNELGLQQCSVTDAGLAELKQLKSLRSLSLVNSPQITGAGLIHIAQLSSLETLTLYEIPQINDDDMAHLSGLKKLTHFGTDADTITDAGFVHLSSLPSLESLSLENARLTDTALSLLAKMPKLEDARLGGDFTDEGLKLLEGLSALKYLRLSGKGLSVEAIEELKKESPSLAYVEAKGASPRSHSLIGRRLTEFEGISIRFDPEQAKGKMILICFFDVEQRPSRQCMTQLAKQAEQLRSKGVTVVAVQASKIAQEALNQWIKKNNIRFPTGIVPSDFKKTRFNWGVKSLPWLILTDENHVVSSSGFSLAELDSNVQSVQK
jgi:internalin A